MWTAHRLERGQGGEMMGVADAAVAIVGLICVTVLCCVAIHDV